MNTLQEILKYIHKPHLNFDEYISPNISKYYSESFLKEKEESIFKYCKDNKIYIFHKNNKPAYPKWVLEEMCWSIVNRYFDED